MTRSLLCALCASILAAACGPSEADVRDEERRASEARTAAALERWVPRIMENARTIEDSLQPVAFLDGNEEYRLRTYLNDEHLVMARRHGVDPVQDSAQARALLDEGRLVELEDSTEWWVVRDMDYSLPLVVPSTRTLLQEMGTRFQASLDSLGLPPLRMEITSALRTAGTQAALRGRNANAAGGTSTHEYGTTVDVAYSAFSAPPQPVTSVQVDEAPYLRPALTRFAAAAVDASAARKSRELKAILGRVLHAMQDEGKVRVTLERGQPVYHMTVAADLAGADRE